MISASGGITLFPAKNPRPGPDPGGGSSSTGPIVLGGGGGGGCYSSINQINMESLGCQASANTRSNAGMVCREICSTTRLVSYFISFLAFFSAASKKSVRTVEITLLCSVLTVRNADMFLVFCSLFPMGGYRLFPTLTNFFLFYIALFSFSHLTTGVFLSFGIWFLTILPVS